MNGLLYPILQPNYLRYTCYLVLLDFVNELRRLNPFISSSSNVSTVRATNNTSPLKEPSRPAGAYKQTTRFGNDNRDGRFTVETGRQFDLADLRHNTPVKPFLLEHSSYYLTLAIPRSRNATFIEKGPSTQACRISRHQINRKS